jgi:putative DNA methylase
MIFEDASIEGFEPDARLTAMWLWTLAAPANETALGGDDSEDDSDRDVEDPSTLRFRLEKYATAFFLV